MRQAVAQRRSTPRRRIAAPVGRTTPHQQCQQWDASCCGGPWQAVTQGQQPPSARMWTAEPLSVGSSRGGGHTACRWWQSWPGRASILSVTVFNCLSPQEQAYCLSPQRIVTPLVQCPWPGVQAGTHPCNPLEGKPGQVLSQGKMPTPHPHTRLLCWWLPLGGPVRPQDAAHYGSSSRRGCNRTALRQLVAPPLL